MACASQEAEAAERAEPPMVSACREIVKAVIDYGVEKDDWKKTWKADARVSHIDSSYGWGQCITDEAPTLDTSLHPAPSKA